MYGESYYNSKEIFPLEIAALMMDVIGSTCYFLEKFSTIIIEYSSNTLLLMEIYDLVILSIWMTHGENNYNRWWKLFNIIYI